MHFDRQILYLACLFGIHNVSGLAIPEQSHPLEKVASVPSSDSSRTAHGATRAQESETAFFNSAVPTNSRFGRIFPSADPRIIDSASRATLPSFSYDTAPNLVSAFHSSDLYSTRSVAKTSTSLSAAFPTLKLDDWIEIGHQHELRQVAGATGSSASMSSAVASAVASDVVVSGSACSTSSSVLICSSDGSQFGFCVDGHMVWRPVAPGTMCSNGEIQFGISSSVTLSATSTASATSISAATEPSSTQSGSNPQTSSLSSTSSSTLRSTLSSSQSQSGTTVAGGATKSNTGTKTEGTTSQTSRTGTDSTVTTSQTSNTRTQTSKTSTQSTDTTTQNSNTRTQSNKTGTQSTSTGTQTSDTSTQTTNTGTHTSLTGTRPGPTGMPPFGTSHTGTSNTQHPLSTTTSQSSTTGVHPTMSTTGLSPAGNTTLPGSDPSHPLTNASVAGIASGLAAGAVMVALGGLYAWRRKKQGKPLFGARGSQRSTGSFYPKSAWLYDPPVSPNHSRAGSEAGQNLIPPARPETSEMEAGRASPDLRLAGAASPDLRAARASSPLLPPPITITRDESPDGSPGESPRRSGGRRSRPMMSINEDDE